MTKRPILIVTTLVAVVVAGLLGWSVVAESNEAAGENGGFLQHLHQASYSHGDGGGHHQAMGQLIDELDLRPDQQRHMEKIHEIIGAAHDSGNDPMARLHERLVTQYGQYGSLDSVELKQEIDGHVEEIRAVAYAFTDELVALVNGLDATQRETLLRHLQEADAGRHGHGH